MRHLLLVAVLLIAGCGEQQPKIRVVQLHDGTVLRGVTDFCTWDNGRATFLHEGRKYSTSTYTYWTEPLSESEEPHAN